MFGRLRRRFGSAPSRHARDGRGQILVIFAFGLIAFLGFAALTVDVGALYVARRDYQNATDAAALAGANYLTRPLGDPCADGGGSTDKWTCARTAAWNYLNDHLNLGLTAADISGYAASNTGAAGQAAPATSTDPYTVWVSTPPNGAGSASSMSTVGTSNSVLFVRVDKRRDTFFGKIFVPNGFTVSAWSTAGIFPNRFAVITLRRGQGGSDIDSGPSNTKDIKIAGSGSTLTVIDGDVGGNYGMTMPGSGSRLKVMSSSAADEANVYLIDYVSCGSSCWSPGQIVDGSNNPISAKKLPSFVNDPNYAPIPNDTGAWPTSFINNSAFPDVPNGDTAGAPFSGSPPDINIDTGTVNSSGKCVGSDGTIATAPMLGPGTYRNITVQNGSCVVLDPIRSHSNPNSPGGGTATFIGSNQQPGVFYVTDTVDVRNSALIVGDGVTVVIRPKSGGGGAQFSPGSGGVMDLNRGLGNIDTAGDDLKLGGWTTKGTRPYAFNGSKWVYQAGQESNPTLYGVGIALYVLKPDQVGYAQIDTTVIQVNSGAGLSWQGVTYAPHDNVSIAGQPNHAGVGQLIAWTFTFNGGTNVTQTFDGPGDGFPYLIEPCVLTAGSCS